MRFSFFSGPEETESAPSPASYVVEPLTEVWVKRGDDGAWRVAWRLEAGRVCVYAAAAPTADAPARLIAEVAGAQQLTVTADALSDVTAVRPYFRLTFHGGPADGLERIAAERFLPLARGVNFRDAGGYATADGRFVRWGRVYRSGLLAHLSDADLQQLAQLDLKLVCDFRSAAEAERSPDRLPESPAPRYRHLPVTTSVSRWRQIVALFRQRHALGKLLLQGYTGVVIDENAGLVGEVLRQAADPANLPLLIHCTAGKDRTGVTAALLLAFLGVDDETVIADYTLSNLHYDGYAPTLEKDVRRLARLGFSEAQIRPILVADAALMQETLAYVRHKYGSVADYLRDAAGCDAATLQQVRANLLTE